MKALFGESFPARAGPGAGERESLPIVFAPFFSGKDPGSFHNCLRGRDGASETSSPALALPARKSFTCKIFAVKGTEKLSKETRGGGPERKERRESPADHESFTDGPKLRRFLTPATG